MRLIVASAPRDCIAAGLAHRSVTRRDSAGIFPPQHARFATDAEKFALRALVVRLLRRGGDGDRRILDGSAGSRR
jgi:hypothetical protein